MGTFTDIAQLFSLGYGWLFVLLLVVYELYAPILIGKDTALAPLVRDMPEKVEDIDESQDGLRRDVSHVQDHVEEVQDRQKVQMQVQRAQARANDQMDERQVDAYLLKNGVEPNEFLHGDEMEGYGNWSPDDTQGGE